MSTARRKPPQASDELRAALAGLALQGLLANPDISARLLLNKDPEEPILGAYIDLMALAATHASGKLLEELNK